MDTALGVGGLLGWVVLRGELIGMVGSKHLAFNFGVVEYEYSGTRTRAPAPISSQVIDQDTSIHPR